MSNNQLENTKMNYEVNGEDISLTMNTVREYLVRGNADKITDQEIVMFMNLCKYQKLNPFLNEAYLVKFGNDAQIITGKEAFMKRAEAHEQYTGFEAGILVTDKQGALTRREGTFKLPDEDLVGGWAKIYRADRKVPVIGEVSMEEYSKNQSTWKSIPSTMIRKVALVQALREAFPSDLGAMYTEEEAQEAPKPRNVQAEVQDDIKNNANKEVLDFDQPEPVKTENWETKPREDNNQDYERQLTDEEIEELRNGKPEVIEDQNSKDTESGEQGALFNNMNDVTPGY